MRPHKSVMRMKKLLLALFVCLTAVISLNANTIEQNGVYVTVGNVKTGHNGYGDWIDVGFSLSSNTNVTVHVKVTNGKGEVVKDTWVDLTPKYKKSNVTFSGLSGGSYNVTLVQH